MFTLSTITNHVQQNSLCNIFSSVICLDKNRDGDYSLNMVQKVILQAAELLRNSSRTAVFTGAGISVESGIPPFRGPSGIWEKYDQSILDIERYYQAPDICWHSIKKLFYSSMTQAEPNAAHTILGKWEQSSRIFFTITQNIDGLHQKGGVTHIAEFHGNAQYMRCTGCSHQFPISHQFLEERIPICPDCGRLLKPDFVFFGENIPEKAAKASYDAAETCNCMLVIGSSGEVYPAAGLPFAAKQHGATIIEINPHPSQYTDKITDCYIPIGSVDALLAIDAIVSK